MAIQNSPVTKPAPGNAAAQKNKTPAPTANFERNVSADLGDNIYGGPVSLPPGSKHVNEYLGPSDPVRDTVIARGLNTKGDVANPMNFQIRDIGKHAPPDAHGMASARTRQASAGGAVKIPATTGASESPLPSINAYRK